MRPVHRESDISHLIMGLAEARRRRLGGILSASTFSVMHGRRHPWRREKACRFPMINNDFHAFPRRRLRYAAQCYHDGQHRCRAAECRRNGESNKIIASARNEADDENRRLALSMCQLTTDGLRHMAGVSGYGAPMKMRRIAAPRIIYHDEGRLFMARRHAPKPSICGESPQLIFHRQKRIGLIDECWKSYSLYTYSKTPTAEPQYNASWR